MPDGWNWDVGGVCGALSKCQGEAGGGGEAGGESGGGGWTPPETVILTKERRPFGKVAQSFMSMRRKWDEAMKGARERERERERLQGWLFLPSVIRLHSHTMHEMTIISNSHHPDREQ